MLCLALEYFENCQSRVSFVTFICLDGQILVQKFSKFDCRSYKVMYSFWLCTRMMCLCLCSIFCSSSQVRLSTGELLHLECRPWPILYPVTLIIDWLFFYLIHLIPHILIIIIKWPAVIHLRQHISDTVTKNLVEVEPNTMTSFWNMSTASAPMNITATSVK